MRKGYLTLYMCLMLSAFLSLFFVLTEGARKSAIKMKLECATDIAATSVLGEYNTEVLEQFDLFLIDLSYMKYQPAYYNAESRLQYYLKENLKPTLLQNRDYLLMNMDQAQIIDYSLASDHDGEVLRRQIADYMEYTVAGVVDQNLLQSADSLFSGEITAEKRARNQGELDKLEESFVEVYQTEDSSDVTLENPADIANETRLSGVLNLVLDEPSKVSSVKVDLSQFAEYRSLQKGSGVSEEALAIKKPCGEMVMDRYFFEKLSRYDEPMDKALLKYQIEYLIGGENTDWKNLEEVCKKLLAIREAVNVSYIFTDEDKMLQAELMAAALSAVILMPELLEPVKISILFAWAYVESLQDIKIILEGGRVPAIKTGADWHTSLDDIFHIKSALRHIESSNGLSYADYLKMLVSAESLNKKMKRFMNIIEMDIRKATGNDHFQIDGCMDSFQTYISINSDYGYEADIVRRYGYYYAK